MPRPSEITIDPSKLSWLRLQLENARHPLRTVQALSRLQEQMDNECEDAGGSGRAKPESGSNLYFRGALQDAIRILADVAVQDLDQLDGEIENWTANVPTLRAV